MFDRHRIGVRRSVCLTGERVFKSVVFVRRILKPAIVDCTARVGGFLGLYACHGLLVLLQILHILWFITIMYAMKGYAKKGQVNARSH